MRYSLRIAGEKTFARYAMTLAVAAASLVLWYGLVKGLGLHMPPFITFYPAVMLAAVAGGLWPGLLATAMCAIGAVFAVLPPVGHFSIVNVSDQVALGLFAIMGVLISLLAEHYRRSQRTVTALTGERELWLINQKLELALASMTDAVFISDAEGQVVNFNDAFARFYRFRSKAECPRDLRAYLELIEMYPPGGSLLPLEERAASRALRGESDTNAEFHFHRTDTGERWIGALSFNPLRDKSGAIVGSVVVARDITERKDSEEKLRASEAELATAQALAHLGSWYVDLTTGKPHWSAEMSRLYYRDPALPVPSFDEFLSLVHPEDRAAFVEHHQHKGPFNHGNTFENRTNPSLGPMRHLLNTFHLTHNDAGVRVRVSGTSLDITEQRRAEAHIRQLTRVYAVLSDTNQTIVRVKDTQAMLEAVCRIAVEKGAFRMAWVGMANAETGVLEPVAWSGDTDGYLEQMKIRLRETGGGSGPAAQTYRSGNHSICNDIEHELYRPWKSFALQLGYRSMASFPLKVNGAVQGVMNLYATEEHFFDEEETRLLDEMAMDISFALEVNLHEQERRRAEEHIRRLTRVYAVLSDTNQMIVRVKDTQAMLEAACRIAVEKGKFRMAWVGMVDAETQIVEPVASAGAVDGYLDKLRIDLRDPVHSAGPAAQSILTERHILCNDIEHNPAYFPWRGEALRRGYRSSAAFPLKDGGRVVGNLNIYADEPGFFVGDELALLGEMAMDMSFALEVNRHEKERAQAEEELRWRTAFFEAQVESALDGVLVVDEHARKILQNERFNELLRIPPEIAGNADDAPQFQFVASMMKDPVQFTEKVKYLMLHPDEVSRDEVELQNGTVLDRYSSPVRNKEGHTYGRIWTFRDITEKRRLEAQFRQAQKMEALGQLTGGIAHDFNNLLTVILGCSEVLSEEMEQAPRLKKMAGMIADAARQGAELIHRMLAFARRQTLQPEVVDLNRMLTSIEKLLRRTLSANIDLEFIHTDKDCRATVDRTQLESAILNLCVNSRDAMPHGGRLSIAVGNAELDADYAAANAEVAPGKYVLITVSDTGSGIEGQNLSRVFDPFFTTKEAGKGTGLGLSMVYGFVKQSRGHVRIYSEPGHGTAVKIFLPCTEQENEAAAPQEKAGGGLRGTETILLAEDNAAVREFTKSQLMDLGYTVFEAGTGREALAVLAQHPEIDLLFTDMVMPGGMNGGELAAEACKRNAKLKVLYCSGYARDTVAHEGLLEEGVQFLNKPYTRADLAKRLREALSAS